MTDMPSNSYPYKHSHTHKDFTIFGSNVKYNYQSLSEYCLPNRQPSNNNENIFVWERKYTIDDGLYQFNGLYESINNN